MTTTTLHPEVTTYLTAVRDHLADLPADDRDELLEDLEAHLIEVAAEADEPLAARLGPPEDYAAELRASAGLPPAGAGDARTRRMVGAQQRWRRTTEHPIAQRVRGFLPELRPGWWVLRAVLAVWVLALLTSEINSNDIPFPPLFGSQFVGTIATVGAIPLSVRLGRRQDDDPRRRRIVRVAEAGLLLLTIPLIAELREERWIYNDYGSMYSPYEGMLVGPDGMPIANIYATDANGDPIEQFQLFDQNGWPITNVVERDDYRVYGDGISAGVYRSQPPVGPDGRPLLNGFPRDAWIEGYDGVMTPVTLGRSSSATTVTSAPTTTSEAPTTTIAPDTTSAPESATTVPG